MLTTSEVVEVKYSNAQNAALSYSFLDFYKLDKAPAIRKTLLLDKAEYVKFLKSRTRARTQFEAKEDVIDLSFSDKKIPFEFIGTKTEFIMPSGEICTLIEELDRPNGLTAKVTATYGTEDVEFDSYFRAEAYALTKYLGEINK